MQTGDPVHAPLTGTERALWGDLPPERLRDVLDTWVRSALGSPVARVRFRAGRIDAVWGLELEDGRAVVVKTHRPPADRDAIRLVQDAQRWLADRGFPCALPMAGPDVVDGRVLTAETLVEGRPPDGRDPADRLLLAEGLVRHLEILRARPDLVAAVGPGPSWTRYQGGPWPTPHDPIVDFRSTPDGWTWLDDLGRRAADAVLENRDPAGVVVGHADWYAANCVVADGVLTGTFDWELVADDEAVLVGFAASCFGASPTGGGGLSTPEDVAVFLDDVDTVRARPLTTRQRRTAGAAAAWILAFNARWQVGLLDRGLADESTIALVRDHGEAYLAGGS